MPRGRILVTGGSGLLGSNIAAEFASRGEDVVAQHFTHRMRFPSVSSVMVDLTNFAELHRLVDKLRPAWIVHSAAATNVDWCELHASEAFNINSEATGELARAAKRVGAGFIYISTDGVFDGTSGNYTEEDDPRPLNTYAKSKLDGERFAKSEYPSAVILRLNIYGWNAQPKLSLSEWVLERLCSNQQVLAFVDVVFSPLPVNCIVDVLLELIRQQAVGTYHVGSRDKLSKYDFATRIARTFGLDETLIVPSSIADCRDLLARRPRDTSLHVRKVENATGRPMPPVLDGLNQLKSLRDNGFAARLKTFYMDHS